MAVFDAILLPAQKASVKIAGLAASTSSSEQTLGNNEIFAINADQDITIKFGAAGLSNAATTDFRIPANSTLVFDVGTKFTSFKVFNQGASAANIYYMFLSKF